MQESYGEGLATHAGAEITTATILVRLRKAGYEGGATAVYSSSPGCESDALSGLEPS